MSHAARLFFVMLLAGGALACQQRTLLSPRGGGSSRRGSSPAARGRVQLTDRDLAPVDAYISTRNAQWILADDVVVVVSKEYFSQVLTVNRATGLVERTDTTTPAEITVTLRFLGDPATASIVTNPRVMIGTGLTITARRTVTVRLLKTRDANLPVRLEVTARGKASRGRGEQVTQRGPELRLGGYLRRTTGGYAWTPIGG